MVLLVLCCVPAVTWVHRDDLGRWAINRTAMSAPDEFSYLLMARSIADGQGISTLRYLGRDTFYPPGYPLQLAAWGKAFGFSIEAMHACNVATLGIAALVAFFLGRAIVRQVCTARYFSDAIALLTTALFVTNWHVLETAIFVFSEPLFMLITFAWLGLSLKWPRWWMSPMQTAVLAVLAVAAAATRSAGIVCVLAMLTFVVIAAIRERKAISPRPLAIALLITLLAAAAYFITLHKVSPEKSPFAGTNTANSYSKQLANGLTDGGRLTPKRVGDWPKLTVHVSNLALSHAVDAAESFVPWYRDVEPKAALLSAVGKAVLVLALIGWLGSLLSRRRQIALLDVYIAGYAALYLLWPFNMTRFWSPLLPIMLAFAGIAVDLMRGRIAQTRVGMLRPAPTTLLLLGLLLILSVQELRLQLGFYQRRLNYVSDSLARSAATIKKLSPDANNTIVAVAGGDEHFVFAWYLNREPLPTSPRPNARAGNRDEFVKDMLARLLTEPAPRGKRLFVVSYFTHGMFGDIFRDFERSYPELAAQYDIVKVQQHEIISATWEVRRRDQAK